MTLPHGSELRVSASGCLPRPGTVGDQIVAQAKARGDQLLTDTKNEIERLQAAAQRELGGLTRQTESISGYLAQIRQLLSTSRV